MRTLILNTFKITTFALLFGLIPYLVLNFIALVFRVMYVHQYDEIGKSFVIVVFVLFALTGVCMATEQVYKSNRRKA